MKSFPAPSVLVALFSGLLLAPTGALAGKVVQRDTDYRSVSEEILGINQQQEQLANLQVQAEISNNVSSLEGLNAHTSEIVQRWCNTTQNSEKERQQRLGKLIGSNVPELERIAARETRASEVSYDRLVISACKLQKEEIHDGLLQDLAVIQLRTEGSAKTAATGGKATAASGKEASAAAAADSKTDKEFQAYMDSVESGGDSETNSGKNEAKHEQDAEKDATIEEGEESDQEEEQDDTPAQKPTAMAAAASAKKPQASHEKKAQEKPIVMASTKEKKHKTSFLQLAHMEMLSQMSLTQMLELFTSYTDPKKAKKWCGYFESKGKSKTLAKPLKDAHSSLDAAKDKFEKLKVLQLGQKKESKLRARFAKFWQADATNLESLLQHVEHSRQGWAAKTRFLNAAVERKATETAQARFKKVAMLLEEALGERRKNIKEQEQKVSSLQSALANAGQDYQDQEAAVNIAKSKLEKVEAQIARIMDVCNEIKREGPKLLFKGALSRF